jgi:predicted small lipoprotein YifL
MSRDTRRSAARAVAGAVAFAAAALLLAGCGQKGPLYLPDPAPQAVPPLPGSAPVPAGKGDEGDRKKPAATATP